MSRFLYFSVLLAVARGADICVDGRTGFASMSQAARCPTGSAPFRAASANQFNVLWSAWHPTKPPHPRNMGNLSTSFKALEDMAAANLTFFRVFGSPWAAADIMLWQRDPAAYWAAMEAVVGKATSLGLRMHVSITPTLSQWALAFNTTVRSLITDPADPGRSMVKAYVTEMVSRYKDNTTVLTWGMGNELNLAADGCAYANGPGMPPKADTYFSTAQMMAFANDYIGWIRALDPRRPIGSDFGKPRTRALHLSKIAGGGAVCVDPVSNPHGDCEVNCSAVPRDTRDEYKQALRVLTGPFDMVSVHDYGCYPPFAAFEFCEAPDSLETLSAAKEVADELQKPLFVGEYGSPASVANGWACPDCMDYPTKLLQYQAAAGVQLSNIWTWCGFENCVDPTLFPDSGAIVAAMRKTDASINLGHSIKASED